jgi:DNA-binding MarR family transcriptional regulator
LQYASITGAVIRKDSMKKLVYKFRSALRQLDRVVNFYTKTCINDITIPQCHVLLQIENEQPTTSNELARLLNLDISTISRTVDNLLKVKLIEKKQDIKDRRYFSLKLTDEGLQKCNEINADADEYITRVINNIPSKNKSQVLQYFEILVIAFVKTEINPKNNSSCCELEDK